MTETATSVTVEALAEQFTLLRGEVEELRRENARLRSCLAAPDERLSTGDSCQERHSRRKLLGAGMKLAAGALGAGVMLAQQAEPARADAVHTSTSFVETNGYWAITAFTNDPVSTIEAMNGSSGPAVWAFSSSGTAIHARSDADGNGIEARSHADGACGVYAANDAGYGVAGDTNSAAAIHVEDLRPGVLGRNAGTGPGVVGHSWNLTGDGVYGTGKVGVRGVSPSGNGVMGEGGSGYGGQFAGTRAQLRLKPTGLTGRPTTGTHQVGELYLDKLGVIYVCTVAGTPGTWRKVSTTAT